MKTGQCALCHEEAPLHESHIIPRFAVKWLKESDLTRYLRRIDQPNLRSQDGMKPKLLCTNCEKKFSRWEKSVREEVFAPVVAGDPCDSYSDKTALCALSIAWRTGVFIARERVEEKEPEHQRRLKAMEEELEA